MRDGIIIDSLKHFSVNSGSYRNIFSGAKYELPRSDKIDIFDIKDKNDFFKVLENNSLKLNSNSLSKIVSSVFTGISKKSILSFENDLKIDDTLSQDNSSKIYSYINNIISATSKVNCKNFKNDYSLFLDKEDDKQNLRINFFLDDYYIEKEDKDTFNTYRDYLLKLILLKLKKLNAKLITINDKINECHDADKYRLYGELITSNLYRINDYNQEEITIENFYDNNNLITIKLDPSITPSANAKKFFKKYKKLKKAKDFVDTQKNSLEQEINYLESILYEINSASNIIELNSIYTELQESSLIQSQSKKVQKLRKGKNIVNANQSLENYIKLNIDGFTVLIGKNNKQNEYLTTKIASKNDIWFHVKDFHGSHLILRTENKIPSQETINKCASLAKQYSKAKDSNNITVDYTLIKYIKKIPGSKPGMVTYTHNQSVIVK